MDAFKKLIQSLQQLVKVYGRLLDIVEKENQALIKADLNKISIIHATKEKLVSEVQDLDAQWPQWVSRIAQALNVEKENISLLELAPHAPALQRQEIEELHSVLQKLVHPIVEWNQKNEALAQSALSHVAGAMDSITSSLNENPTYKKSGDMEPVNKEAQGRLVSREA